MLSASAGTLDQLACACCRPPKYDYQNSIGANTPTSKTSVSSVNPKYNGFCVRWCLSLIDLIIQLVIVIQITFWWLNLRIFVHGVGGFLRLLYQIKRGQVLGEWMKGELTLHQRCHVQLPYRGVPPSAALLHRAAPVLRVTPVVRLDRATSQKR